MTLRTELWPANRLYWAVIEASQWRRSGPLPAGLQEHVEELLPLPASELHLVCVPVEGGRLLVCGAPRAEFGALPAEAIALTPEIVPDGLGVIATAGDLNLLVGEFEARVVARARARVHLVGMAAALLIAALAMMGLHRRAVAWDRAAGFAAEATGALLKQHAPGRSAEQLALEVQRRQGADTGLSGLKAPEEAAPALVQVLQGWPKEQSAKPLSLNVTPRNVAVSLVVQGDASAFIESFRPPPGWSLEEPRLNSSGETTRVNLQLHQDKEKPQ